MRFPLKTAAIFFLASRTFAADSSSAGALLRQPAGVRAASMGEAYTAADDDVLGIHYNPAIGLKGRQLALLYDRGALEDHSGAIAFGAPVSFGRMAASVLYYDAGSIDLDNMMGNRSTVSAGKDYLGTVSLSVPVMTSLSIGGNLKVLHSKLVEEFSGTAYLFDLGAAYKPTSQLSFGFAAQNLGTGIKYAGISETLPKYVRGGAAYTARRLAHRVVAAFDEVFSSEDSNPHSHVGLEYVYANLIALRVGYKTGYDLENISYGIGLKKDSATIDIGVVPQTSGFGTATKMSLTLRF